MRYSVGLEDIETDHWVAWVFDLPGCFSSARAADEAVARVPQRIAAHIAWLAANGRSGPRGAEDIEFEVTEVFYSYVREGNYVVNAFFESDRRPLSETEVKEGLWLLGCTRRDLLKSLSVMEGQKNSRQAYQELPAQPLSIVEHVAWAEWWYFDRLGMAFPREEMPAGPFDKLDKVRAHSLAALPGLTGDGRIAEKSGERWSARKVWRRMLWHERDHTQQILSLVGAPDRSA